MNASVTKIDPSHRVTSIEELEALYGKPLQRSLIKEIDYISDHYRAFIEKAPFVVVATSGPEGLDSSPRGDPPGFVRVVYDGVALGFPVIDSAAVHVDAIVNTALAKS